VFITDSIYGYFKHMLEQAVQCDLKRFFKSQNKGDSMKILSFFKPQNLILGLGLCASVLAAPLVAAQSTGDKINEIISSCPWIGLIAKEITYGPITISKVDIAESGRLVFCQPEEKIEGTLKYKIDSSKLDSWNFHHIVVGLRKQKAQSCVTHSLGIWDEKGVASFSIEAPLDKGIYEVCFSYYKGGLCSSALQDWKDNPPDHSATIGILVVE
jgi:hypothetical protein